MIRTFKDWEAEKIFNREKSRKVPQDIQRVAFRKLRMIENAETLDDLKIPPSNRLEKLKGDRAGKYSIRINDKYRVCFEWHDNNAFKVEIVDYH